MNEATLSGIQMSRRAGTHICTDCFILCGSLIYTLLNFRGILLKKINIYVQPLESAARDPKTMVYICAHEKEQAFIYG